MYILLRHSLKAKYHLKVKMNIVVVVIVIKIILFSQKWEKFEYI